MVVFRVGGSGDDKVRFLIVVRKVRMMSSNTNQLGRSENEESVLLDSQLILLGFEENR